MSYYVIKGPAGNGQYLGPTVCGGFDYGCPQWCGTLQEAARFPDADGAWKWLDLVQEQHPDNWYSGRVVRVQTARDRMAERAQLRQRIAELELHLDMKEMVIKGLQRELAAKAGEEATDA